MGFYTAFDLTHALTKSPFVAVLYALGCATLRTDVHNTLVSVYRTAPVGLLNNSRADWICFRGRAGKLDRPSYASQAGRASPARLAVAEAPAATFQLALNGLFADALIQKHVGDVEILLLVCTP
jgi:hypothetical protein